jgi:uncharacterized protein (DUF1778 family)
MTIAVQDKYMVDRTKTLTVRVAEDEDRMLKALAELHGMTASDIVRQYIRRAFAEAFPPKKAKR